MTLCGSCSSSSGFLRLAFNFILSVIDEVCTFDVTSDEILVRYPRRAHSPLLRGLPGRKLHGAVPEERRRDDEGGALREVSENERAIRQVRVATITRSSWTSTRAPPEERKSSR